MEFLSPYILAVGLSWAVAQGTKYLVHGLRHGNWRAYRKLYVSGSMPSAHSAAVVALLVVVGVRDGTESAVFGIAAVFAAIVMYDAVMVRRSSGEQGIAIQALIRELKSKTALPRAARGHEPIEVLVGALVGAASGLVVLLAT